MMRQIGLPGIRARSQCRHWCISGTVHSRVGKIDADEVGDGFFDIGSSYSRSEREMFSGGSPARFYAYLFAL
jgi:hypothetical protein